MKKPAAAQFAFFAAFALATLPPAPARAALTASEQDVVRTFIRKGVLDTAPRVRALVGRPDLGPEEVGSALLAAYAETPFDAAHQRFTDALLFGPGSAAARNTLVPAVVEGLLTRASAKMGDLPIEASAGVGSHERAAVDELLRIHRFVDEKIANAGSPPVDGHDGAEEIRDDALRAIVVLYQRHLVAHERWLKTKGPVSTELTRVRAQASLALIDVARGVVGRHELVEALALDGVCRGAFERLGILVLAPGSAPEGRIAEMVRILESTPHAANGLSLWLLSKASTAGLVARGRIARAGIVLTEALRPLPRLWPEEVTPSFPDAAIAGVAASVAEIATARSLAMSPALQSRAPRAAAHAAAAGASGYLAPSVARMPLDGAFGAPAAAPDGERVVAGAVQLLLLDGQRAFDLAAIRAGEGRPEPLEQLALALTVLGADASRILVGRTKADGSLESFPLADVKQSEGLVSEFVAAGKRYTIVSNKDGVFEMAVDGALPKLSGLTSYQERTTTGETWSANGVEFHRLFGEPRATGLDDGRLVLEGQRGGFDAIVTGEDVTDVKASALIYPVGTGGGLLVRATPGETSYIGVALMLEVEPARARLLLSTGKGKAIELSDAIPLPKTPDDGYSVSLEVIGDAVTARVGKITLSGKLPPDVAPGRVGVTARAQGRVDVRKFSVGTPKTPSKPASPKSAPPKSAR